ncbi:MAG: MATE family efflux transporter [Lachnospiraceae bacterium]|nr:MATE family efflux transporter [Lachnospiraceae bacterium]
MKTSRTALNLTEGRPVKLILLFAIPVFLGNLFQILYSLVDTKIVGSILGEEALAAVGSVSILYTLLTGFFNGLSLGFSVVTARFYGSGEEKALKRTVAGSIVLGFLTAAVIITFVAVFLRPILVLLNVPQQQLEMALSYITLLVCGMFVTLAYNLCANTLRAIGDSITPLIFLIIAAFTNVVLDYVFILVFGMGVMGAAAATLVSQFLSVVLCLVRIYRGFPILHIAKEDFALPKSRMIALYESGLSMGLMSSLVNLGSLVLQSGINQLGTNIIVAHTAARKVFEIWGLPVSVLGSSMATYCGQNYGAGRYDRIRQGIKDALFLGAVWDIFIIILAHTVSPYLIRFIASSDNEEIVYWGTTYLRVDMSFLLVCLFIIILRNCMQGFGDYRTPIVSSFIELVGKLVFTFVFVRLFGYWGIIWTEPVVWFLMVIPLITKTLKNPIIRKDGAVEITRQKKRG